MPTKILLIVAAPFCSLLQPSKKYVFGGKSPLKPFLASNNAQKMVVCYGRSYFLPRAMPHYVQAVTARLGAMIKYSEQRLLGLKQ
jgi:hypothetical protein